MYKGERKFGHERDTGRMLENFYFGSVPVTPELRAEIESLPTDERGRYEEDDLFDSVKNHQPDDPTNPKKDLPRELRLAVADELGVNDALLDDIAFYSAVGTPVDTLLGVDAWVEYFDRRTKSSVRGTLDVTMRTDKIESGHKADVVFGELASIDSDEYLDQVDDIARQLVKRMKENLESGRARRAA